MAAMLTGGQRLGLLSTTINNTSTSNSTTSNNFSHTSFENGLNGPVSADEGNPRNSGISSNAKSVVLVKLTDSAFNAISDYVRRRVSSYVIFLWGSNPCYYFYVSSPF